ncbi:unnamed protein product [Medioppia subpectinata]|uniref:Ionotropic glutamate receptor n=1 Tax=Medioppia subpectinata TaxID=1979941 RepID=A0A7R9KT70_9ACAR|nr:unnamed protein product [Medioppia subpectinata]CAG2109061.1 unnamed protein product [Medioppia subpectinata]
MNKLLLLFVVLLSATQVVPHRPTKIVTSVLAEGFLEERPAEPGVVLSGNDRYMGYIKDLADAIADRLNITYSLRLVKDGYYGTRPLSTGRWNGMIGELVANESDIAIAPLTITAQRERVVAFSQPFLMTGITVMMKKPTPLTSGVSSVMDPFSCGLWALIGLSYASVWVILYAISRLSTAGKHESETNCRSSISGRILWTVCGLFTIINSKHEVYSRMWRHMNSNPNSMVNSYSEGFQRVRESGGKYAFLMEEASSHLINGQMPCDTMTVGRLIDTKGYGVATPKGSPLSDEINFVVLKLKEEGFMTTLAEKWWQKTSQCGSMNSHFNPWTHIYDTMKANVDKTVNGLVSQNDLQKPGAEC